MVNSLPSFKWAGRSSRDSCFSSTRPVSISFSKDLFLENLKFMYLFKLCKTYHHVLIWIFPPFLIGCPNCREIGWSRLVSRPWGNQRFHHLGYFEKTMRTDLEIWKSSYWPSNEVIVTPKQTTGNVNKKAWPSGNGNVNKEK